MKYSGLEKALFWANVVLVVVSIVIAFIPGKIFLG